MGRIQGTDRLLSLTLEIIYLLTGEEYTVVKRCACCGGPHMPGASVKTPGLVASPLPPPPHSQIPETSDEQKILELTNKIIQLLTGEVPVRCDDVAVYLTVEEWEYAEGHGELYRSVMAEEENSRPVGDGVEFRNTPEGCGDSSILSQNYKEGDINDVKINPEPKGPKIHEAGKTQEKEVDEITLRETGNIPNSGIHTSAGATQAGITCFNGESPGDYTPEEPTQIEYTSVSIKEETDPCGNLTVMDPPVDRYQTEYTPDHYRGNGARQDKRKNALSGADGNNKSPPVIPQITQQYKCPECPRCYSTNPELVKHQRIHKVKKRQCPVCGKMFPCNYHLRVHQRTHTGEKPYSCSECGASFTAKSSLVTHQRTHTGEKPFGCCVCGKRFSRRTQLTKHENAHTREKSISCAKCGNGLGSEHT